jgi:hypothetical protein
LEAWSIQKNSEEKTGLSSIKKEKSQLFQTLEESYDVDDAGFWVLTDNMTLTYKWRKKHNKNKNNNIIIKIFITFHS